VLTEWWLQKPHAAVGDSTLDALTARQFDEKRPEPVRGDVVVHIVERATGQACLLKSTFNGRANTTEEWVVKRSL